MLKDDDGNLLTTGDAIQERWADYVAGVLDAKSAGHMSSEKEMFEPSADRNAWSEAAFASDQVEQLFRVMPNGKGVGPYGLAVEFSEGWWPVASMLANALCNTCLLF